MPRADFELLGLPLDATAAEAKHAFRTLAHQEHPDKSGGDTRRFMRLQKAYENVCEDLKRPQSPSAAGPEKQAWTGRRYDPFADLQYDTRAFFQPDNPNSEGLERSMRAKAAHCPYCNGSGRITKNIHPEKGFLGLETRLCKCQLL